MMTHEPADAFNLPVCKTAESCQQISGYGRTFLFLKFAVLISIFLFARPYSNVMNEGCAFEYERRVLVQLLEVTDRRGLGMHFSSMLYAFRVAIVMVNHGESQFFYFIHLQIFYQSGCCPSWAFHAHSVNFMSVKTALKDDCSREQA